MLHEIAFTSSEHRQSVASDQIVALNPDTNVSFGSAQDSLSSRRAPSPDTSRNLPVIGKYEDEGLSFLRSSTPTSANASFPLKPLERLPILNSADLAIGSEISMSAAAPIYKLQRPSHNKNTSRVLGRRDQDSGPIFPESPSSISCRRYGEPVDSTLTTDNSPRGTQKFSRHFFNYLLDGHNCIATNMCVLFGSQTPQWAKTERDVQDAHAPTITMQTYGQRNISYDPRWLWHVHEPSAEVHVNFQAFGESFDEAKSPADAVWEEYGVFVSRVDQTNNYGHSILHVLIPMFEAFWERGLESALNNRRVVMVPLDGGTLAVDDPPKRCLRRRLCGRYCKCDKSFVPAQVLEQLFKYVLDPFAQRKHRPICFRRALLAPATKHILDMKQFSTSSLEKKFMYRTFSDLIVRKVCPSCITNEESMGRDVSFLDSSTCRARKHTTILFFTRCPPGKDFCAGSSSGNGNRAISNAVEVKELLSRYGNVISVNPGTLSLEEQIRLVRRAHLIIGAIGSAMTNLLWMRRGHAYIELSGFQENKWSDDKKGPNLGPYNVHTTFLELAETMELRVLPYVDRFSDDRPTANRLVNDIRVRIPLLESLVQMGLNCSSSPRRPVASRRRGRRKEIQQSEMSIAGRAPTTISESKYPDCFRKEHPDRTMSWDGGCLRMGQRMPLGEGVMVRACEASSYFGHALGARNCHATHVCVALPAGHSNGPIDSTEPVITMYTDDPHVPRHWKLPCPLHREPPREGIKPPATRVVTLPAASLPCNATWGKVGVFFTPASVPSSFSLDFSRWTNFHGRALVENALPLFETLWEHGQFDSIRNRDAVLLPLTSHGGTVEDVHHITGESIFSALFYRTLPRNALVEALKKRQTMCFEQAFFEVAHKHMLGSRQLLEAEKDKRSMYRSFSNVLLSHFCKACSQVQTSQQESACGAAPKIVLLSTERCNKWPSIDCTENASIPFSITSMTPDAGRTIVNKNELISVLRQHGASVTIANTQYMTLRTRMKVFHDADIVIGPSGSWMVDLLWVRPGKVYIELNSFQSNTGKQAGYSRGYTDIFTTWQELALAMELRLFVYVDKWSSNRARTNSHLNSIFVDAKELESILQQASGCADLKGGIGGIALRT